MSLTSYRAAPPRVGCWALGVGCFIFVLFVFFDLGVLEDLAATYSPVS